MHELSATVCLIPEARSGPFLFHGDRVECFARAVECGYRNVELFVRDPAAVERVELRAELSASGLKATTFGTGGGWIVDRLTLIHDDPSIRERAERYVVDTLDLAAEFDAKVIIGSMQGRFGVEGGPADRAVAIDRLGESLAKLNRIAGATGAVILFEPLNRYESNLFNTVVETKEFLERRRLDHVSILADLFHMNIEERSTPAAIQAAIDRIGHVHWVDSNRLATGFGQSNLERIARALIDAGYRGTFAAECFPKPDAEQAARRSLAEFRRLFT